MMSAYAIRWAESGGTIEAAPEGSEVPVVVSAPLSWLVETGSGLRATSARPARGTPPRACLRLELLGQACDERARGAAGNEVQEGLVK